MAKVTTIQWADTTVNPIMGCGGCELFPPPGEILATINRELASVGVQINSQEIYKELVDAAYSKIDEPLSGHKKVVNTTNIWHLRKLFLSLLKKECGGEAEEIADRVLRHSITCYAAVQHLKKGQSILKPDYKGNPGFSPIFESVSRFEGRSFKEAAKLDDLYGCCDDDRSPWKAGLPRLIFVSDMGDALSSKSDFAYLKSDLIAAITSDEGKRHIWLWLTKRPERMAEFAKDIGGLPPNVCAMTTLTGPDEKNLQRLTDLKKVRAHIRGLSIEPLLERIPPEKLNLDGIHWAIVGGESGSGLKFTRPFALEWAKELRDHCRHNHVAYFLKQLGRNPSNNGKIFKLSDSHGGNWHEWPTSLHTREFPAAFHNYRKTEMKDSDKLRPVKEKKKKQTVSDKVEPVDRGEVEVIDADKAEFQRLNEIVRKGVTGFIEAGDALRQIQDGKLWRAGGFDTWEDYCRSVAGMSRIHAHRLMQASECVMELRKLSDFSIFPENESQVRPLLRIKDPETRIVVWDAVVKEAEERKPVTKPTAREVANIVSIFLTNDDDDQPIAKPPTRKELRSGVVSMLRAAVAERHSWEAIEKLLDALEKLD